MADNRHLGRSGSRLERAAREGAFYRLTADEWSDSLGISRQRFHQIRCRLGLPTRRAAIHQALTDRLSWKARSEALWRVGIFNRRGDCWETMHSHAHVSGGIVSRRSGVKGDKRKVLFALRYWSLPSRSIFGRPACGHRWCINPEHQIPVDISLLLHQPARSRVERIAAALEAGERQVDIALREGVHSLHVSKINRGLIGRGVREKYPIRAPLKRYRSQ
jgi:hypothetical protein